MNCKTLQREIVPYYLGELPEADRGAFERHLQVCTHCARFAYDMSCAVTAINDHYPRKKEIDLWPEVNARLDVRGVLVPRWAAVPVMTMALLGLAITTTLFRALPAMQPSETEIVRDYQFFTDYELWDDIEVLENRDCVV